VLGEPQDHRLALKFLQLGTRDAVHRRDRLAEVGELRRSSR
jgi:hypothetical protein